MRYFGGKSKTANQIATYLNDIRQPDQPYWEPFIGAGWILERIHTEPIFASDVHPQLVAMWQALQNGWVPPKNVTEAEYKQAKAGGFNDALTAFIGFGGSFGGKWWGGYARGEGRNWTSESHQGLLQKINRMDTPAFFQADFMTCYTPAFGCLIYCDPPYNNTTAYKGVDKFDTYNFWARVRWLEEHGHTVIVSEYEAPQDFCCVLEIYTKTNMDTKNGKSPRIERLFRLGNHPKFQGTLW